MQHHCEQRDESDHEYGDDVTATDSEHAAEQRGFETLVRLAIHGEQHESDRERCGGDHTDGRVRTDDAATGNASDEQTRGNAPQAGTEEVIDAHDRGGCCATEHGVRESVPDVAHAPEHHVHADQATHGASENRNDDGVAEELELIGLEDVEPDHDAVLAFRRRLKSPRLPSTTTGIPPCSSTSIGAP